MTNVTVIATKPPFRPYLHADLISRGYSYEHLPEDWSDDDNEFGCTNTRSPAADVYKDNIKCIVVSETGAITITVFHLLHVEEEHAAA
jgi:hypothetical protein